MHGKFLRDKYWLVFPSALLPGFLLFAPVWSSWILVMIFSSTRGHFHFRWEHFLWCEWRLAIDLPTGVTTYCCITWCYLIHVPALISALFTWFCLICYVIYCDQSTFVSSYSLHCNCCFCIDLKAWISWNWHLFYGKHSLLNLKYCYSRCIEMYWPILIPRDAIWHFLYLPIFSVQSHTCFPHMARLSFN